MFKIVPGHLLFSSLAAFVLLPSLAQEDVMHNMADMDMATHADAVGTHHHMDMSSHMKMTSLRKEQPGDQARAQQVAETARKVCEKYRDYKTALADGYRIFMPNVPQKQYHFNNRDYAREAAQHFNPEHPTSLLYEKDGDGYKLIGVMYTAPRDLSEDELNQRIPLSIAQWHAHVNLCLPPLNEAQSPNQSAPKFGFHGSITTEAECQAAGGTFRPQIFGWMVHVYPFAEKPSEVWSLERQVHEDD